MNAVFTFRRRIRLLILLAFCGLLNSISAQDHFDFTYTGRDSLLSDGWDFTGLTSSGYSRNTEQITGAIISYSQQLHPGVLRIPVDIGDLWEGINNTRNTLFRDLPPAWTSIRLKIASFNPSESNQQATLVAYQDDDNYVQISRTFEVFNRIMFTNEAGGIAVNLNSVDENATANIYLRLDRNTETETITSYYSLDGTKWTQVGTVVHPLINPRLAIEVGASPGGFPEADFAWAEVSIQPLPPVTDELHAHPASIVFKAAPGENETETRSIFIFSSSGNIIEWKQSADVSWLIADTRNGVTDGKLKVSVNPSGLAPGIYHGNITIESLQSTTGSIVIPVSLIVNPDMPVKITAWKDGIEGAMSISVDDGQPSGFNELNNNGFKGTYVTNGSIPPPFYTAYYNSGMELGSHLVSHPCNAVSDNVLRSVEIQPNITNLSLYTPVPLNKIISLVWPCGFTNYREQAVASEFFLSARGYNINQLEDSSPENLMNLKSYNSHEHPPFPPADLKTLVDSAILRKKWFNLVLHNMTNDDGAINYAKSKNIWVTSIGSVIKYILQRDRIIFSDYGKSADKITFNVSRLSISPSLSRDFEQSFGPEDVVTMQIDIDDDRLVGSVLINGEINPFQTKLTDGNRVLLTNIRPQPGLSRSVEVNYRSEPAVQVRVSSNSLNFNTVINRNPENQLLLIEAPVSETVRWNASVAGQGKNWRLNMTPNSGVLNDTLLISIASKGLPIGNYQKLITITSPDDKFYPFDIDVNLSVNPAILHQNYPNPFNSYTWIEYDLPEEGPVTLEIFNSRGQKSFTVLSSYQMPGNYKLMWDARNFPSGIYLMLIRTKNFSETIKMALMK